MTAETAHETEEQLVQTVVDSFAGTPDPRLHEIMQSLTRHLHGFLREVRLTPGEWSAAIEFLTATGHASDELRQEFILLSDVLGVSMQVDGINAHPSPAATASTVLGPFHVVESPPRELGANIDLAGNGDPSGGGSAAPCLVSGTVRSTDGSPLGGASIDAWQADDAGFYDVQQPDTQPERNGRGLFTADEQGRFWFRTIVPAPYPIPTDGPVGVLLAATGRHPDRPAHIHLIVSADGHRPVTTHVFVDGDPHLDSDAVFAVKRSLVACFDEVDDPSEAARHGLPNPFRHVEFDVMLAPE